MESSHYSGRSMVGFGSDGVGFGSDGVGSGARRDYDGGGLTAIAFTAEHVVSAGREGGCVLWWDQPLTLTLSLTLDPDPKPKPDPDPNLHP